MQHAKKVPTEHLICTFSPKTDLHKNYNSKKQHGLDISLVHNYIQF